MAGIGDLSAYYDDFAGKESTQVPKPRPKPARAANIKPETTRTSKPYKVEFPNSDEALADAVQYQQFYDMPTQRIADGTSKIPFVTDKEMEGYQSTTLQHHTAKPKKSSVPQRASIAAELQASRHSALSALGMDPSAHRYTDHSYPEADGYQTNGITESGQSPQLWANLDMPGVLAHEAAHRGLFRLMNEGVIPHVSAEDNELLIQRLMATKLGNPLPDSEGGGPTYTHGDIDKDLADFEARAAKYLAQQDPAGPR